MLNLKQDIRRRIKLLKNEISIDRKNLISNQILQNIENQKEFRKAEIIMAYSALPDEVQTAGFIEKYYKGKTILLPCVRGDDLILKQYTGKENMQKGDFGILEPSGDEFTDYLSIDLIIVPGVAFDSNCNRLGRGKAFYDGFLKKAEKAFKIGICFDFQIVDSIPIEPHDIKMDMVITESKVIN